MSLLEGLEIYIPMEAEVRSVPLLSLPRSVLRKMDPTVEAPEPSDSAQCVWICPALFQKKGQKKTRDQGGARQHMLTVLGDGGGRMSASAKGSSHWKMSFVTANTLAYRVLKDTLPLGPHSLPSSSPQVPQGSLSNSERDAVIIYHGRIYLSVKRKPQELSLPRRSAEHCCDHSQTALSSVDRSQLKRKAQDSADPPQPQLSDRALRGARHSPGASQTSTEPQAAQSQGNLAPGAAVRASTEQEEEFNEPSFSPELHMAHSSPHSPVTPSYSAPAEADDLGPSCSPPAAPAAAHVPVRGPLEPSAQQEELRFEELQTRERIAQMKAKLREKQ